jgi:hypothetical protein
LEQHLDERLGEWVELLGEMRPLVLERVKSEPARRELFTELARWYWLERLKIEGVEAVRLAMRERIVRWAE